MDVTVHRHDGLYLRMGIGLGYGHATTTGTIQGTDVKGTYEGLGPAYELLIGGTPFAGFVIGGGFVGQDVVSPTVTIESNDPSVPSSLDLSGALGVGALGPFVDWFPDPTGGAHVGAMIGFGLTGLKGDSGIGGSLWTGYDFWVGSQWSLGAELRAAVASGHRNVDLGLGLFDESPRFEDRAQTYELLFTALLH